MFILDFLHMLLERTPSFSEFYISYLEMMILPVSILVITAVIWAFIETTPPKPVIVDNTVQY